MLRNNDLLALATGDVSAGEQIAHLSKSTDAPPGSAHESTPGATTDEHIAALRIWLSRSFEAESIDDPDRGKETDEKRC